MTDDDFIQLMETDCPKCGKSFYVDVPDLDPGDPPVDHTYGCIACDWSETVEVEVVEE